MSTNIRLSAVRFDIPAFVLGISNNKMAVWVQGCSLNKCAGCMSAHTWSTEEGYVTTIDDLISAAKQQQQAPTGLVISGGEPTDQIDAVIVLIAEFKKAFPNTEVIMYSGRPLSVLQRHYRELFTSPLDVIVAEPYVDHLPRLPMAGSSNQKLVLLSNYAQKMYADFSNWPNTNRIMVYPSVEDGVMTIVGVPNVDLKTIFRG